jgi:hypothetical protein
MKPLTQVVHSLALAALFVVVSPGCGGDDEVPDEGAGCATPVGEACAGLPAAALCDGSTCTEGVACAAIIEAADDATLAGAAAEAGPGACIALAPGTYAAVQLPGGVSLLGRSAADVKLGGVALAAGDGAVVRGIAVGASGISTVAATNVRIEAVLVDGATGIGIDLGAGSSASIVASEVSGAAQYGLRALDTSVTVERAVIRGVAGPGLWAQCQGGCDCAAQPAVTVIDSLLLENQLLGAGFIGVAATLDGVEIAATAPQELQGGGGVAAAECAQLSARKTVVRDNRMYGILVDGAGLELGGPTEADTVEVSGNRVGIWVQNQADDGSQLASLDNVDVLANVGVGVGSSGTIKGFVIYGTEIRDTLAEELIVTGGTKKTVGDGLLWAEGAMMTVDGLSLAGNARQSILIDGPVAAGSSIANITLAGTDEQSGILQQRYSGGEAPELGEGTPEIEQRAEVVFEVPTPPATPVATN